MTIAPVTTLPLLAELASAPASARAGATQPAGANADFSDEMASLTELKGMQGGAVHVKRADPLQEFEGFVLRIFVESMLPKDNESFFGGGTAGDIWRSMLAERLGDELAAGGGIGIAELLAENSASGAQKG